MSVEAQGRNFLNTVSFPHTVLQEHNGQLVPTCYLLGCMFMDLELSCLSLGLEVLTPRVSLQPFSRWIIVP